MTSKKTILQDARQVTPDEKKLVKFMFVIAIIGIIACLIIPKIYNY